MTNSLESFQRIDKWNLAMPRSRKPTPSYLFHKASGRARAVWSDATGANLQKLLPGKYDSPESRKAFARLQMEIESSPLSSPAMKRERVSVNEVLLAFLEHAKQHYRRADGTNTDEFAEFKRISRHVRELYGSSLAAEFGPLALKALRHKFIAAGWSRGFINQRIGKVRRVFRWAASEELVPPSTYQALSAVTGLQRGRTPARETEPIRPVDDAVVDATLPHLGRHVRGLVELQRLTGCRPGEACAIRRCDIDESSSVWLYKPPHHKTIHRGKSRTITLGPKAQALLKPFFTDNSNDYLFSPRQARAEFNAERAAKRVTPRYPSHLKRNTEKRKAKPSRTPASHYTPNSYELAINRACDRAFPAPGDLAPRADESPKAWKERLTESQRAELKAWWKAHRWSPNQLRHNHATKVRKEFGLEAAGAALGHSKMSATEVYAERDAQLAVAVASKIG